MSLKNGNIIDKLSLKEKVSLLSGENFWNTVAVKRLGIPSVMLTDGPHGLRKQAGKVDNLGLNDSVPATCFPTAAALANSWSEDLLTKVGCAIGAEAAYNGVGVVLGPGLNIVRDPLTGRAFEYFSEDPYISGRMAAAMVNGIQSRGVAATVKHFAVNSQEHLRMSIDEVVDERTMREIYLEGFRYVIQNANPKFVMTAYNKVNGIYANEHHHLLEEVLKQEWGYKGALVTDWGGMHDPVLGLANGGALEMPSSNGLSGGKIIKAVQEGKIEESLIDERIDTLLNVIFDVDKSIKAAPKVDYDKHRDLAIEAARQSVVLLKNDEQQLPLKSGTSVAVIGDFAKTPRYQGAGSSLVNPTKLVSALDVFTEEAEINLIGYEPGFRRSGSRSGVRRIRAIELAKRADVAVVFLGLDESKESEGIDRTTMALPNNQLELIDAIASVHDNVVVVLSAGGAVELPFADSVKAILHGSLTGQASGKAIVDTIVGRNNPSGKLAVSFPYYYNDTPTAEYFPGKERTAEHREGLYVGYRYYETTNTAVRYAFGHGLSYTSFFYSDIEVNQKGVTFSIKNNGNFAGSEIAQLYIKPPRTGVYRPSLELKGFVKVELQPGQERRVTIEFDDYTFAHYNDVAGSWTVEGGDYGINIGASVRDIKLRTAFSVKQKGPLARDDRKSLPSYYSGKIKAVDDEEFQGLIGRKLPSNSWDRNGKLGYDDTISQLKYGTLRGRLFLGVLHGARGLLFALGKTNSANNVKFILNMPFSKIPNFTGGKVTEKGVKRLFGLKK